MVESTDTSGTTEAPSKKVSFSYWSDPLCIWAFLAQDKLDRVVTEFGERLAIETRIVPVFGSLALRFSKGPWAKAGVAGRVEETRRIAAELGHPEVDGECWRVSMPASSWAPGVAVKAAAVLERAGSAEVGSTAEYLRMLRHAFFADNRNIAQRRVLLEVAEDLRIARDGLEAGLDDGSALAALWEDHDARERLKIQGSPTYLFDGGRARLYGNFSYGILRATIEELLRGLAPGGSDC